jgi:hypothetical protein
MIKYSVDSSDVQECKKRRGISFLITSNSAWQMELSTCPSPGLLNLAKIPICFFGGSTRKAADVSSHRKNQKILDQMLSSNK